MGTKSKALKAAIDIGSNTVLLLIGDSSDGKVETVYEDHHAPRLGKGVDANKNLHPDSVEKVIGVLQKYKKDIDNYLEDVSKVFITATSAVRDAANQQVFLDRVQRETGFSVRVLNGDEEAGYTYFGAQSVLDDVTGPVCVLDIGGGSTEVALGSKRILTEQFSYDIGSVRFTERYLKDSPPTPAQIEDCRSAVSQALQQKVFYFPPNLTLVGVAGTVTSLAHIHKGLQNYSPEKINGLELSLEVIEQWVEKLKGLTADELLSKYPEILKGRSDVYLGGLLILETFMKSSNITEVVVSTGGIRHGSLVMNKK